MDKLFFIIFIFLASCAPQVTAVPTATATLPPPTATVIPTPTISPAFLAIQEQLAGDTQDYTILGNGNIEGKLPDGTTGVINGITLNRDGQGYTIMVDGQPVTIDASDVTITDENGVQVIGYENIDGDDDYEKFVKSDAQLWAEANNAGFDLENGVAWDINTGLVIWAQDAKGEWINYPDGNVPIPPGPGYENEPPLMVPYYHSFNEAMKAVTNELPWGEIPNLYREKQNNENARLSRTYYMPIFNNGQWKYTIGDSIYLHDNNNQSLKAYVNIYDIQLPDGSIALSINYESEFTDHYMKDFFVYGNAQKNKETYDELLRIQACVKSNRNASDNAELCKSDTIQIEAPKK